MQKRSKWCATTEDTLKLSARRRLNSLNLPSHESIHDRQARHVYIEITVRKHNERINTADRSLLNHPAYVQDPNVRSIHGAQLAKRLASVPRAAGAGPGRQPRQEHGRRRLPSLRRRPWCQAGGGVSGRRAHDTAHHTRGGGGENGGKNQSHHGTKRPSPRQAHRRRRAEPAATTTALLGDDDD